jgi:hypothetical protein
MSVVLFVGLIWMSQIVLLAQATDDATLAGLLADETTRQRGVDRIVAARNSVVPLLLSWTKSPPENVDQRQLFIGLADAFGQLRTKEAIPFLIKNISLQRWLEMNIWLKTAKVIEERLPAVAALVRIGPDASRAIINEYQAIEPDDRLPAIFVVARIRDPEARGFLSSVLGRANLERYWAEEGLKRLHEAK